MKRGGERDLSPSSKRSRSSVGRYEDSSEDEGRRSSRAGSPARRYDLHRDDFGRPSRAPPPPAYKVLCVSNLHAKASDEMVREALYREFKRFGDVSVKVSLGADERLAYVYFRSGEEAREAKHSKPRILFYDRPVVVEPVYEAARDYGPPRGRSRSPPDYDRAYRPRSPPGPELEDRYEPRFDRRRPPPLPHSDYYAEAPPLRQDEYGYRQHRGRGSLHSHYGPLLRGGFKHSFGSRGGSDRGSGGGDRGGSGGAMVDSKRDKFPNYLHHVPPEEDPLATRTLFAGNLEINISEDELRRIFGRYGVVDDIDIKRPPPGTGNAYAFVRFQNLDMAHRAKIELSGQYIGKFQCKIGYGKVMPTTRVWVGGLGPWTSVTQLTQEFDRFGAIKKIEYVKGENHAYILYESLDAAQAAVKEMRGSPLGGPDKRLRTDFAEVNPPPPGTFPAGFKKEFEGEYREEWASGRGGGGSGGYEEYSSDYGAGYGRGRGRGRGWHERGRGNHRGGYHGDYPRGDYRDYDGTPEGDHANRSPEAGDGTTDNGLGSARTLADVARKTTTSWQGSLILKNSSFGTKMHLIEGDTEVAEMMQDDDGRPLLRITQRLRLDQSRLDDVNRRISAPSTATILLSLPSTTAPQAPEEAAVQTRPLRNLVAYLKQKEAAGVITLNSNKLLSEHLPFTFKTITLVKPSTVARYDGSIITGHAFLRFLASFK
ncbi:RNA-binding protein spenito [Chionoecetes opilio]|uniref:RNA-binding protein spenito n=1 Tax=Chionoecetes opilio TaxID=41210 RepID=A0A8J4YK09_CHIOP|nr:RNA-binding protein spenito [Chionoecetes opilio]